MQPVRVVAIVAMVLGLLIGAASAIPFSRASETGARVDSHLAKAEELTREADSVKESDPARHEQLTQEIGKWSGYASSDLAEQSSQQGGAWAVLAVGGGLLIGGGLIFVLTRRRPAPQLDAHKQPQYR
ncbi:hypothetical protein [Planobispora longispora]|uniref:Uncharacterized protein n=1 Tax=Planobispora longispora TaxID=28887 RepID=A0A8J3W6G9_9ACTN|nr:hypothetical protein [Planobispora longispora]GIH77822.1 hypothetical protein Plo01_42510 [Planobispora longispora]